MSEYFLELNLSGRRVKVKLNLSEVHFKNATAADT